MYFHSVINAVEQGKKARRLGWPKGQFLIKSKDDISIEVSKEEAKELGINEDAQVSIPAPLVLVESKDKVVIGYELTYEDRNHQDWELA